MSTKRKREQEEEHSEGVIFIDRDRKETRLTRKEYNAKKQKENKLWHLSNKIGIDVNLRHKEYYLTQLPFLRDEWEAFHKAMSSPLPVTFRLNSSRMPFSAFILRRRLQDFNSSKKRFVEFNGEVISHLVTPISFLPSDKVEAYQINVDSKFLANDESLKNLSDLLLRESALGHLIRQELVSMIPALALDIQSHHSILDMCAAPGSKTEQLLSLLYASHSGEGEVEGMVVANDADPKRIDTLKKRYSRCGSPNLLITCSRAEDLAKHIGQPIFDRIICDVPCTGDGTFRKFPHQWRLFRPRFGFEIHELQVQIAIASAFLLKPGGRMVYSTCSLNPLENEAVVAALLSHYNGRLELVDTKQENLFPNLKFREGLHSWGCDEALLTIGETDSRERAKTQQKAPKVIDSMRPPSAETAKRMNLDRCMRIMPHDQNTGGFFIAVLEMNCSLSSKNLQQRISQAVSLKALRQLGFNPTVGKTSQAFAAIDQSNSPMMYAVRCAEGGHCLVALNNPEIKLHTSSLNKLSRAGLNELCGVRSKLSQFYFFVGGSRPSNTPQYAITADEGFQGRKGSADISTSGETNDYGKMILVSQKVATALQSWANLHICAQAGVVVMDCMTHKLNLLRRLDAFSNDLMWRFNPYGIQSMSLHLNKLLITISITEMALLLKFIVNSESFKADSIDAIEISFPIQSLETISPSLFEMVDPSMVTFLVCLDSKGWTSSVLRSMSESENTSKRRASRADRKRIKRQGIPLSHASSSGGTGISLNKINVDGASPDCRPEVCLIFEIDHERKCVTSTISKDICQSHLENIEYSLQYIK